MVLASAIANAETNNGYDVDDLVVVAAYADEGPTLKRWRPRARGRVNRIRKRTCHITILLAVAEPGEIKRPRCAAGRRRRPSPQPEPAPPSRPRRAEAPAAEETPKPEAQAQAAGEEDRDTRGCVRRDGCARRRAPRRRRSSGT